MMILMLWVLTPGHLSSRIRRQAIKVLSPSGLTAVVAIRRPTLASAAHTVWPEIFEGANFRGFRG